AARIAPQAHKPARLAKRTFRRDTSPCVSGLYGEEMESVSIWKTSVTAWPKPYEKKNAANAAAKVTPAASESASPTAPAAPETKNRYGRSVTQYRRQNPACASAGAAVMTVLRRQGVRRFRESPSGCGSGCRNAFPDAPAFRRSGRVPRGCGGGGWAAAGWPHCAPRRGTPPTRT